MILESHILNFFDWAHLAQAGGLAQSGKVAFSVAVILIALFQCLAGIGAIIGAALLWISERTITACIGASFAAFCGGAWCGYGWFGWPFLSSTSNVMTSPGGFFSKPKYELVTDTAFSVIALMGNGILGFLGFAAMFIVVAMISPELLGLKKHPQNN